MKKEKICTMVGVMGVIVASWFGGGIPAPLRTLVVFMGIDLCSVCMCCRSNFT